MVELESVDDGTIRAVKKLGHEKVSVDGNRLVVEVGDPAKENPEMIEAIVAAGGKILFVTDLLPSLEEVYLKLVGN